MIKQQKLNISALMSLSRATKKTEQQINTPKINLFGRDPPSKN